MQTDSFDPALLEDVCVHQVYDEIADEFSTTRYSAWPSVMQFLQRQATGAIGGDMGCGNGKYLLAAQTRIARPGAEKDVRIPELGPILAMDRSFRLAEIVRQRGFDVTVGDILRLPYRSGLLDYVLCIAVIHHISTPARRVQAVEELSRLLRPGGLAMIQVWAKEQHDPDNTKPAAYLRQRRRTIDQTPSEPTLIEPVPNVQLPLHRSGTEFAAADMLVPWKKKHQSKQDPSQPLSEVKGRYYHLFVQGELESLVSQVTSLRIQESFYEQGNWIVIAMKHQPEIYP